MIESGYIRAQENERGLDCHSHKTEASLWNEPTIKSWALARCRIESRISRTPIGR